MIIENIIKDPDRILELTDIASKDSHRNAKNYKDFKRRLKNYIAFHVILDEGEVVGFGGVYQNDEWPKDLVRINDRMWHHPTHRFKGLDQVGGKEIGLSSEILIPHQTEFCQVRRWQPFISVEGLSRRKALEKILINHIDPKYGYKLLPDMYFTCTNKNGQLLDKQCWQSVIAMIDDIDLPKMSTQLIAGMEINFLKGT